MNPTALFVVSPGVFATPTLAPFLAFTHASAADGEGDPFRLVRERLARRFRLNVSDRILTPALRSPKGTLS